MYGRMNYQWLNEQAALGDLTFVVQRHAVGMTSMGNANTQNLRMFTRGSTWWGSGDTLPSQTLSLQNRIGFGYAASGLEWSRLGTRLRLHSIRMIETLDTEETFSQLQLSASKRVSFDGVVAVVGHHSWVSLEPTRSWLGISEAKLAVDRFWHLASMTSETLLSLQSIQNHPMQSETQHAIRHVPVVTQSTEFRTDWARLFGGWTHGIQVAAGLIGQYRHTNFASTLDPLAPNGSKSLRGFVKTMTSLRRNRHLGALSVRQIGTALNDDIPRHFTELSLLLQGPLLRLEGRYVHRRQTYIGGRLNLGPNLVLTGALMHQTQPVNLNLLWVNRTDQSAPTFHHGIKWMGQNWGASGDVWHLARDVDPSAAAVSVHLHPQCECLKLMSSVQYQQADHAFLTMLNLQVDIAPGASTSKH